MAITKRDIAQAGLRLLNDVGLEGLTLRRIADELGVKAPALYWHVKHKKELLDEMATEMFRVGAAAAIPDDELTWDDWLAAMIRATRRMLLSYRDGARVFSGTYLTEIDTVVPLDEGVRRLLAAGFTVRQAARVFQALYSFVIGFTIEEQEVYPLPGERNPNYDPDALRELARPRGTTAVDTMLETFHPDVDGRFQDELAMLLAGARHVLAQGFSRRT